MHRLITAWEKTQELVQHVRFRVFRTWADTVSYIFTVSVTPSMTSSGPIPSATLQAMHQTCTEVTVKQKGLFENVWCMLFVDGMFNDVCISYAVFTSRIMHHSLASLASKYGEDTIHVFFVAGSASCEDSIVMIPRHTLKSVPIRKAELWITLNGRL